MAFEMGTSKDHKKYYCSTIKKHIWVLGYFGGGAINISNAMQVAECFCAETGLDIGSVSIAEIDTSQRFKHFKYVTSDCTNQVPLPDSIVTNNVHEWLYN